jgi:hypothetical protein
MSVLLPFGGGKVIGIDCCCMFMADSTAVERPLLGVDKEDGEDRGGKAS